MPFIKVRKPGVFGEAFLGTSAYELVEVDDNGVPVSKQVSRPEPVRMTTSVPRSAKVRPRTYARKTEPGKTPPKIGNGYRAPAEGYSKPFNYHEWNAIRKKMNK